MLVIEWSRLFRLRPAPGHGAVITVGSSLAGGDIGVALLVTSDLNISAEHLVVLTDNRGLQSAENLAPVVHRDVVARDGPGFLALPDAASARLATNVQRALDVQVEPDGRNPWRVAGRWLRAHGLISEGGVGR